MPSASESIISLEEVLDLALELEKRGMEFFATARDKTSDPLTKDFFNWLTAEEDDHYVTFLTLRAQYAGESPPGCDLPIGYSQFIRIMVKEATESLVFREGMAFGEVVAMAIVFEKSILEYFNKIKGLFPEQDAAVIEGICLEEQGHIEAINKYQEESPRS